MTVTLDMKENVLLHRQNLSDLLAIGKSVVCCIFRIYLHEMRRNSVVIGENISVYDSNRLEKIRHRFTRMILFQAICKIGHICLM